jgi:ribosomal protein L11 methyltransferase
MVAALVQAGAPAVQEVDDDLLTHVPNTTDLDALRAMLRAADPGARVDARDVGDIDWAARWPTAVGVQRLGPIAIAPPWRSAEIADATFPVIIDPGTAFGTGEHETTRNVLRLLPNVMNPSDRVVDVGAGSAVLAIAAARMGAARVVAIELDEQAIGNAEANVAANGVSDRVTVIEGDARVIVPLVAPARVILANIISSVILDLAPIFRDALAPGGRAVVSGILGTERDAFCSALASQGWRIETEYTEEGGAWWSSVIAPQ